MNHHWDNISGLELTESTVGDYLGFIYCIEEISTSRKYYGRKQFWNKRGKSWYESDWREYSGSSNFLTEQIDNGELSSFRFTILSIFRTKTGMALGETISIICSGALEYPDGYFNRAAPSVRGKLKITDEDREQLTRLRELIK